MSDKTSYPLCWPEAWPRAAFRQKAKFATKLIGGGWRPKSMADARNFLDAELGRLGARQIVLSTNVELNLNGEPRGHRAAPTDPGAAVYFQLHHKAVVLAGDKWSRVEDNIWAMACHIEALRGQERWGIGNIERAFRGYLALPERSEASAWWNILGVSVNATADQITEAYRAKARQCHPDVGGTDQAMATLNLAYEEALEST